MLVLVAVACSVYIFYDCYEKRYELCVEGSVIFVADRSLCVLYCMLFAI